MRIQVLETGHLARSIAYEVRVYSGDEEIISMYGRSAEELEKMAMDEIKKLHKEIDDFLTNKMLNEASK